MENYMTQQEYQTIKYVMEEKIKRLEKEERFAQAKDVRNSLFRITLRHEGYKKVY